jgi:hypothetical protein
VINLLLAAVAAKLGFWMRQALFSMGITAQH